MGQALYRKYRPKSLSEILGQDHITKTLDQAIKKGQISHAYLFTGPRGVGKTSVARILAHSVNNLAYEDNTDHLDIIEIDAASNRRIDEIRELRDKVNLAPTSAKYKVYIVDEAHMLTKEAFNALLKTLEEPPEHVIFILATTEAHKVPETISSRTQQFKFQTIPASDLTKGLGDIARLEKIKIDDGALALIAKSGHGSFRDSVSLLDQASSESKQITQEQIENLLGLAPLNTVEALINAISSGSSKELMAQINLISESGYNLISLVSQLVNYLMQGLVEDRIKLDKQTTISLIQELIMVPSSPDPETAFELALIGVIIQTKPEGTTKEFEETVTEEPNPEVKKAEEQKKDSPKKTDSLDRETWKQVLDELKKNHNTLYGIARLAEADLANDKLVLRSQFPFHQKRLSEAKNQKLIADIVKTLSNQDIRIESVVDESVRRPVSEPSEEPDPISTINSIFGNTEVLE